MSVSNSKRRREDRKVNDAIHGFIAFPDDIWEFVDTPEFQRLRLIKQLGTTSYIFPCATHSRFEHSLGTAYLCQQYMKHLTTKYPGEYGSEKDRKTATKEVTLAGLFHDIGHGPFSHMFDNHFVKRLWSKQRTQFWEHQTLSTIILQKLIYTHQHLTLGKDSMERVIALILGKVDKNTKRPWQFQLINNKINELDVDKFDYILRDSYYLGVKNTFIQVGLLIKQTLLMNHGEEDGHLVHDAHKHHNDHRHLTYNFKYAEKVLDVYQSRYKLYKHYYFHKVIHSTELMICDILTKVEGATDNSFPSIIQVCQGIYDRKDKPIDTMTQVQREEFFRLIEDYENLNDGILHRIKLIKSEDDSIKEAQQILSRLNNRQLYRFVIQVNNLGTNNQNDTVDFQFNQEEAIKWIIANEIQLYPQQQLLEQDYLRFTAGCANFGRKKEHPYKNVMFYEEDTIAKNVDQKYVTLLGTQRFSELFIRLYITVKDNNDIYDRATQMFQLYIKQLGKNNKFGTFKRGKRNYERNDD